MKLIDDFITNEAPLLLAAIVSDDVNTMGTNAAMCAIGQGVNKNLQESYCVFLHQLAADCETRNYVQLRRYQRRQLNLYDHYTPCGCRHLIVHDHFVTLYPSFMFFLWLRRTSPMFQPRIAWVG